RSLAEEKAAAVLSLVHMYETVSQKELEALLHSDRAGLRHLGSELIAHLNLYEEVERLVPLLQDASIDVRLSAMNTLGLLQVKQLKGKATLSYLQSALQDNTPAVSITAAWLALYLGHDEGKQVLKHWMEGGSSEVRRLASAALATLGSLGIEVIVECLQEEKDPYVRVNLALGLIGQRSHIKQACDVLYEALQGSQGVLWMWEEEQNPLFRSLAKSTVSHHEQIPRYPQVVDQMTRLELLSILSTLQYPEALTAVREFLQKQEWGVTGAAASILLQEGDAGALVEVHNLLQDTDEHVRLQAALLLGIVGRDPEAIEVLMTAYPKAGKELKIHILEALGFIGDRKALPFLLDIFQEPFQGLRIVSACSVIQCVNH
ncbi:MAG: HEAT repeat domain-containing protein, partial [Chlamydiae bacterium]|nr:HEAT repeat domain-containing protein [Chlamydiota bacterium]